jgi:hypothetical protein
MMKTIAIAGVVATLMLAAATAMSWTRAAEGPAAPAAGQDAAPAAAQALTVTIAQPLYRGARGLSVSGKESHFHVIVSNVSKQPQKVWRNWCSWGYFNLTFKVTDEAGKETILSKIGRAWTKNFPDSWTLEPGDMLDIEVHAADWANFPMPAPGKNRTVRLQAVYEINPDPAAAKESVWTGRVASETREYVLTE